MSFPSRNLKQRIILRRVIQGLIVIGIFLMAVTTMNHENDIFWQLRMGEEIVAQRHFPVRDAYNFSNPGATWTLHEWLPSAVFYLINSRFGATGLILFKSGIIALVFALFMLLFNRLKANLYLSLTVFSLAALVNSRGLWAVFPSIFEYLFLVGTLLLLEIYRQKPKTIIPVALTLLSFLWANSHGSFFLLSIIIVIYLVGDLLALWLKKRWPDFAPLGTAFNKKQRILLLIVVGISLIAPLFTPNGYQLYLYPFRISLGKFSGYVNEYVRFWQAWHGDWSDYVLSFTFILFILLGLVAILARRRLHPTDVGLGLFFSSLALLAVRHVAIFSLVALFIIVRYLGLWFGEYRGIFKRTLIKDILVIFLILFFIFYYKTKIAPLGLGSSEEGYPKEAAEFIMNNQVQGNMFNHYNYGGYLIGKMRDYKVFIDGRLEMYEGQAGQDYMTILLAKPGYKELLDKYKINFFISYLTDPIIEHLAGDSEWKYVYHDRQYVVFVRNGLANAQFLASNWSLDKQEAFQKAYKFALVQGQVQRGIDAAKANDAIGALTAFETAISYDPQSLVARLNLATILVNLNMLKEAKSEYEHILSIDANNPDAKEGMAKVEKLVETAH